MHQQALWCPGATFWLCVAMAVANYASVTATQVTRQLRGARNARSVAFAINSYTRASLQQTDLQKNDGAWRGTFRQRVLILVGCLRYCVFDALLLSNFSASQSLSYVSISPKMVGKQVRESAQCHPSSECVIHRAHDTCRCLQSTFGNKRTFLCLLGLWLSSSNPSRQVKCMAQVHNG
jgi:hypothetical protein